MRVLGLLDVLGHQNGCVYGECCVHVRTGCSYTGIKTVERATGEKLILIFCEILTALSLLEQPALIPVNDMS